MNNNGIAQKCFSLGLVVAFSGWLSVSEVKAQSGIAKINVYPADVQLLTQRDSQKLIVVATRDDDVTLDVTNQVKWTVADEKLVNLSGNLLKPVADGETKLTVEFSGHKVDVPISVKDATKEREVSFKMDVMALFLRAGCNTGSCHGSARGKDGFNLSIFGFDPDGDHHRITRENSVRRINLAVPEASLLIEKAIGAVPHTGGKQFSKDSEYYETMYRWLAAGAPKDPGEVPTCEKVEIYPPKAVLEGEGTTQQFIVKAFFSDGSTRDVTNLTMFSSSNGNSAPITKDGLVTAGARGEAFVMARYDIHTVGSQTVILPTDLQYEQPKVTGNYIDELVGAKLHNLRILPSEVCTDEEYLRRTSIDITGHLPTAEEYQQFMADNSADKRAQLVNRLLERKEFSEIWAMKWAQILMIKSVNNQVSYKSAFLYNNWLTEKIANEVPLDQMVREMLSASGGTFSNPATNFYQIETDTLKTAENVAQVFMGIRTQCAQCHNHPFDRWTMDDYYSFAAFFAQIGRKTGEDYRERIIYNRSSGDVRHLVGNKIMAPKFLGGATPDTKGRDRRELLAEWLTSSENELFSTSVANRIWQHFTGVGIIDPVDDIRVSNPPSNPELFKTLGGKLTEYKFDFKALVRDICASKAYQRSTVPNDTNRQDTKNFAYAQVRRIPAEQLLDCISQSTNTQDKFKGLPLGAKAVQIADGTTSNYFLTTFGRSERETACAGEATTSPTLSQSLHMINGSTTQTKISQGKLVSTWITEGAKPEQVIEKIYIRCLSRKPNEEEISRLMGVVEQDENVNQGLEDVFWAVLNSREYLFNH
ncbi:MAG: cell surface protein [Blastopirellula sp.]|nr:MAG: cell surface protein [Blastopirellula sp.]